MLLLDQVPVSSNEEIEVDLVDKSGAKQNPTTGELRWEFDLPSNQQKEFKLKYAVKYPKNKSLMIE